MRRFLFIGEQQQVLGVWEVENEVAATRLHLQLSLKYPHCETIIDHADDFEELKADYAEYEFGALEPDLNRVGMV